MILLSSFSSSRLFLMKCCHGHARIKLKEVYYRKKNRHNQLKVCFANRSKYKIHHFIYLFIFAFFLHIFCHSSFRKDQFTVFLLPPCTRLDSWPLYSTWLLWVHGFKHLKNTLAMHASLGVVARHEKINC